MTGYEYQQAAARTLLTEPDQSLSAHETMMLWTAFGLAGEAGEVVEDLKKGNYILDSLGILTYNSPIGW